MRAGPPPAILIPGLTLGLVSLVPIAVLLRRGGGRRLLWALVGCRVLSALTAVPAFIEDGVPSWAVVVATVFLVLTAAGCALVTPAVRGRGAPVT